MPYAIHLRKSRADLEAEARGEGESLSRHRKRLYDLAARRGYDIAEEYAEIISGDKLADRPEMQRLLNDVATGRYEGVLDIEIARLTRGDLMDQGYILNVFKFSGTKIITPEHIYDLADDYDEEHLTSDMAHARRELKYTKKRLQRGRDASAMEGLWQGPAPYGYRKVKIPRGKGWTLEIDEQAAPFVRMIFDMYANSGVGGSVIADRLNSLGSRTAKGNLWSANSVRSLSTSPVYAGKVRWNDRISKPGIIDGQIVVKRVKNPNRILVDGQHPALVDPDVWEAVQRARKSHDKTRKHTSVPARNPLAGLVFCSVCGKSMIRKDNGNASGSRYDMLRCTTKGCPTTGCALSIVERSVLNTLSEWLVTYADDASPRSSPIDPRKAAIAATRANIDRLRTQRDRIFSAYEDGAYDAPTFVRRRNAKDAEIAAAETALADLERDTTPSLEECIRLQLPAIRSALELYSFVSDPRDKNRLLKSVISRIEYKKTTRCFRNQDPSKELELSIYPFFVQK
ncbi:MAG: recombinase family protein [Clostridia bacterium]|nr:recombinase family protein [Clostridia bacterium]